MNTQQQQAIDAALEQSLRDEHLSSEEERALRDTIGALADEREALAFVRNRAFRKARDRIERDPTGVLRWLERIDKIVDNTSRPPESDRANDAIACAFSPGEEGLGLIRRELNAARQSLDICVFTITDDRITDAILRAHERGIAVRVITDNDKQFDDGSDIARLVRERVPIRFDAVRNHMHHKFALVDNKRLLTGSYNWTRGATRNHENVIVLADGSLIAAFGKEFDRLWNQFHAWQR